VALPARGATAEETPERRALAARLDALFSSALPELLDWAEEYRGARADAAAGAMLLLDTAGAWLRQEVARRAAEARELRGPLAAFRTLADCRKALAQRNANPQMVAERALFALQAGLAR
jgi:hypothetical protein